MTRIICCRKCISIHALREEGDPQRHQTGKDSVPISIHALREEGDSVFNSVPFMTDRFLSTPSARRATVRDCLRSQSF